jgi:prepilin-type N-terminal cleavage/methylation domain-containing protein
MKKGFSLLEVVVAIAIIAIIGSIIVSGVNKFKQKGESAARSEFVRQAITALEMHYGRKGGYPLGSSESQWCFGLKNGETCTRRTTTYQGNTTLYDTISPFFSGITKQTNPMWGKSPYGTHKYDAIVYYPGSDLYRNNANMCNTSTGLCQGYQLSWYLPGESQDCSPGFRQSCGTNSVSSEPLDLTFCQINVPRTADDTNKC